MATSAIRRSWAAALATRNPDAARMAMHQHFVDFSVLTLQSKKLQSGETR
ncbi:hypothetical protein [Rhodococcus opacus]|nr:hypothetical protein [Rhodococcus opacus]